MYNVFGEGKKDEHVFVASPQITECDDPKSIDPFIQYILKYTKVILGTKFTT